MDKHNILAIAALAAILLMPVAFSGPLAGLPEAQEPDHMATQFVWLPTASNVPDYLVTTADAPDYMATEYVWLSSKRQVIATK